MAWGWARARGCAAAGTAADVAGAFFGRGDADHGQLHPGARTGRCSWPAWWCSPPASRCWCCAACRRAAPGPALRRRAARCASASMRRPSRPPWRCWPSSGRWRVVPTALAGKAYYEILFWGGGHALQFTWTLLMLVAGCGWPAPAARACRLSPRVALLMFALALASVFVTPYAYLAHDVASRRAPQPAHLGHALRRRRGDPADGLACCCRCSPLRQPGAARDGRCARR